jgi:hypothetical protein
MVDKYINTEKAEKSDFYNKPGCMRVNKNKICILGNFGFNNKGSCVGKSLIHNIR